MGVSDHARYTEVKIEAIMPKMGLRTAGQILVV